MDAVAWQVRKADVSGIRAFLANSGQAAAYRDAEGNGLVSLLCGQFFKPGRGWLDLIDYALSRLGASAIPCAKGRTPLWLAVEHGRPELVALLLRHGVLPDERAGARSTPLFRAIYRAGQFGTDPDRAVVDLLLEANADPLAPENSFSVEPRTPLSMQRQMSELRARSSADWHVATLAKMEALAFGRRTGVVQPPRGTL